MEQEEQFLQAFEDHADSLYRHACFRVSDREIALDIVQDTFAKAWEYLIKGNTIEQFRPFLYRTLNNAIIDEYRRKRTDSLDAMLEEEGILEGRFDALVTEGRETQEYAFDAARLMELLQHMPERYRQVVIMRHIDGLQPQEISEILEENVNVISVRIHRGMRMLRAELNKRDPKEKI